MVAYSVDFYCSVGHAIVVDESFSKEAENFEFEPWPQASGFGSWKASLYREVMSGSTHPRLVRGW